MRKSYTIYVVKKSTESQIESNKDLIKAQSEIQAKKVAYQDKADEIGKILDKGGKFIVSQNILIIDLYKYIVSEKQNTSETIYGELKELNRIILSDYHLLLLILDESSSEFKNIKNLGTLFLQVAWDCINQIKNNKDLTKIYLSKELSENIKKRLDSEIFQHGELLAFIVNGKHNAYDILTFTNSRIQKEIKSYLDNLKAA